MWWGNEQQSGQQSLSCAVRQIGLKPQLFHLWPRDSNHLWDQHGLESSHVPCLQLERRQLLISIFTLQHFCGLQYVNMLQFSQGPLDSCFAVSIHCIFSPKNYNFPFKVRIAVIFKLELIVFSIFHVFCFSVSSLPSLPTLYTVFER